MKQVFAWLMLLALGVAAQESDSIQAGDLELRALPLAEGKAQISACWQSARGEMGEQYWRTLLEEKKVGLQAGVQRSLGSARVDVQLEQTWQEQLESRRAQLTLSVPYQGWTLGGGAEMDWQRPEEQEWQPHSSLYQSWLETPRWHGLRAKASWQRNAQEETRQLAIEHDRGQWSAEVAHEDLTARRRWLTRFHYDLRHDARLATEYSQRWQEGWSEPESRLEARFELRF